MNLSFLFQMLKKIMFLLLCLVQIGMVIFYMVPYEIRRTHKKKKTPSILRFSHLLCREELLVEHVGSNIKITREVLQCLRQDGWLNDKVTSLVIFPNLHSYYSLYFFS